MLKTWSHLDWRLALWEQRVLKCGCFWLGCYAGIFFHFFQRGQILAQTEPLPSKRVNILHPLGKHSLWDAIITTQLLTSSSRDWAGWMSTWWYAGASRLTTGAAYCRWQQWEQLEVECPCRLACVDLAALLLSSDLCSKSTRNLLPSSSLLSNRPDASLSYNLAFSASTRADSSSVLASSPCVARSLWCRSLNVKWH